MRAAQLLEDGWFLEDGEAYNRAHPKTFSIPHAEVRKILEPGDWAKLMFAIAVEGEEAPTVERMWVIVRERVAECYLGILDNEPRSISPNDGFRRGMELPFEPKHIIQCLHGDEASKAIASAPVAIPWH